MNRKIYATVEGTIPVHVRVRTEVCIEIEEGEDIGKALLAAARGEDKGDGWDVVDCGILEVQDTLGEVEATAECVDPTLFKLDNIVIEDSK